MRVHLSPGICICRPLQPVVTGTRGSGRCAVREFCHAQGKLKGLAEQNDTGSVYSPAGKMKLKRFLLRYYPPGIILEHEQGGKERNKNIGSFRLSPRVKRDFVRCFYA